LSYARPRSRRNGRPRGDASPRGGGCLTGLATGHQAEVCALSGRGDHFMPRSGHYGRTFAFSAFPCPPVHRAPLLAFQSPARRRHSNGVSTFRTCSGTLRVLPFRRRHECQHVASTQRDSRASSLPGRACQSLGPFRLGDGSNGGSHVPTLQTRPGAYPDAISRSRRPPSRESASREGLHSRSASHRTVTRPAQLHGQRSLKAGLVAAQGTPHRDIDNCMCSFRSS